MMILIKLTKGYYTKVDDRDARWVREHSWCASDSAACAYAIRGARIDGKNVTFQLHREVLRRNGVAIPRGLEVDHINNDPLDNRFCNLRVVTRSQNNRNRTCANKRRKHNLPRGVFPSGKRFRSQISINKMVRHLGVFPTAEAASRAFEQIRSGLPQ